MVRRNLTGTCERLVKRGRNGQPYGQSVRDGDPLTHTEMVRFQARLQVASHERLPKNETLNLALYESCGYNAMPAFGRDSLQVATKSDRVKFHVVIASVLVCAVVHSHSSHVSDRTQQLMVSNDEL